MRALFALALLLSGAAQAANVTLDGQGNITGIFNLPQPGLNTTVISDNDARIATFVAAHAIPGTPNAGLITKQQFLGRFTGPELLAIATAAQTIPQVNVWLITAQAYTNINLLDPLTKQGLDAIVAAGLLTQDRETAILTP